MHAKLYPLGSLYSCFIECRYHQIGIYQIYLSSDGEDILGEVESDTCCTRSTGSISTRSEKVRKRFRRRMQYFIANRGSCNYDAERIGDIEFPLRYINLVQ